MKKVISVVLIFIISTTLSSQIGIHTNNPQTSFHVDSAKDNVESGKPTLTQQSNDVVLTSSGNMGLGTLDPTDKLDIFSGNIRIREINDKIGTTNVDRVVVADQDGILKTIGFGAYTLFHSRLASDQTIVNNVLSTLVFANPLATSSLYTYNTANGILTFNQPGNYLVTLQASFANIDEGEQLVLGIRPFPDANYLGRGSHYVGYTTPVLTAGSRLGELMSYTTMIVVPTGGYQIRFTAAALGATSIILSEEIGPTGRGNVTNVTIQKI
ncbi:hypothetical protein [Chryseobacterium herbae]|uniref:DUF4397 domain-containing protein n=1 Tax=Chryseobacterium herbae TaxID=2976476 RepID=A0ABT2IT81_9FLAO|nr:hypothetical protein [Chryseobacterium sp. pc1-10]MCT2562027.1 hypothetical protein [Chryseobacterium sp. pc1-10]